MVAALAQASASGIPEVIKVANSRSCWAFNGR
jgi:hypothetical protein